MRRLPVLCPQEYDGISEMNAVPCTRCWGWDNTAKACTVTTGAEHLPDEIDVPVCPMQSRCQHQIQSATPCVVRSKGLICESALVWAGMGRGEAANHALSFNAEMT